MTFEEEIRTFIDANGVQAFLDRRCALPVIAIPERKVAVIPVPVRARTLPQAGQVNACLRGLLASLVCEGRKSVILPEDIWRSCPEMMQGRLLAQLGRFRPVFARNTSVRRIDKGMASEFLGRWHTYGDASARYRYGMFTKGGELVAVASFSSGRTWQKEGRQVRSYEWVRYASLPDVRVVGGMGKVLKFFIADVRPDDIMSYADLEWTDGSVYRKLGFDEDGGRDPVSFSVDIRTWERQPLRSVQASGKNDFTAFRINLGSLKYRLKLY